MFCKRQDSNVCVTRDPVSYSFSIFVSFLSLFVLDYWIAAKPFRHCLLLGLSPLFISLFFSCR